MRRELRESAIRDRFERWREFLRAERATPILMVGVVPEEGRLVITTVKELTEEQVQEILAGALLLMRRGEVEHR